MAERMGGEGLRDPEQANMSLVSALCSYLAFLLFLRRCAEIEQNSKDLFIFIGVYDMVSYLFFVSLHNQSC